MAILGGKRTRIALAKLPLTLNGLQILLGIFIVLALAVVIFIFEEFTAFTDYTQQWIEFNFFIYYWDKLTISRVYLWFIFAYGWAIITISGVQLYAMKKHNLSLLHIAPLLLIAVAIITVLGAIVWLIVTAVNYNEGFLATGGFIFERMRFKGNVWKDLIYREQSFKWVTHNLVPYKAPILKIWVHQRERDFSCCGWESYMDYAYGNYTNLPESCCQKKDRVYGCADNWLSVDRTEVINTRGCRGTMYPWYRSGFIENIVMALIGMLIGAFQFYLYTLNRGEYYKLLDEMDDLRKPMMNTTMSMSTINSKMSAGGPNSGHMINFGPQASGSHRFTPVQRQGSVGMGSMIGMSNLGRSSGGAGGAPMMMGGGGGGPSYMQRDAGGGGGGGADFNNPLQNIHNMSGRFGFNRNRQQQPMMSTPSDRYLITDDASETPN